MRNVRQATAEDEQLVHIPTLKVCLFVHFRELFFLSSLKGWQNVLFGIRYWKLGSGVVAFCSFQDLAEDVVDIVELEVDVEVTGNV